MIITHSAFQTVCVCCSYFSTDARRRQFRPRRENHEVLPYLL